MLTHSHKPPKSVYKGLQCFNERSFFDAHEDFEDAWRKTPGEEREFYRALLQISGGFYRLTQNNLIGANKFLTRAMDWLALFPDPFQGMATAEIVENLQAILDDIARGQPPETILNRHFKPILIDEMESK